MREGTNLGQTGSISSTTYSLLQRTRERTIISIRGQCSPEGPTQRPQIRGRQVGGQLGRPVPGHLPWRKRGILFRILRRKLVSLTPECSPLKKVICEKLHCFFNKILSTESHWSIICLSTSYMNTLSQGHILDNMNNNI